MLKKAGRKTNTIAKTLRTSTLAAAVLASGAVLPNIAAAEVSASFAVSNMYLYRGINLSDPGAAVSGSLDYAHHSGLYAGVWTSSEGREDNTQETGSSAYEYDLYFGYAGSYGDFGYDVGLVEYVYPTAEGNAVRFNSSELYLNFSYMDFGIDLYFSSGIGDAYDIDTGIKSSQGFNDSGYYFAHYTLDDFTFGFGGVTLDSETKTANSGKGEYNHIDVIYNATDELSFTLSQVVDRSDLIPTSGGDQDNDLNIAVTWAKSFDL